MNNYLLEKYITQALRTNNIEYRITSEYIIFRCNVCGDSKKHKFKKRGHILRGRNPWMFYCHNCSEQMTAERWLKQYYPLFHKEYIKEMLKSGGKIDIPTNYSKITTEKPVPVKEDYRGFISLTKEPKIEDKKIFDIAIAYCKARMIPKDVWKTWYIATEGKYKNRLIIPFYDDKGNIYYFQGRSLMDWMTPKYLNMKTERSNIIYNWYHIDKSKPVIVTEGPIDSLFLDNAIATLSCTHSKEMKEILNALPKCYYLFDNDDAGREQAAKYLKEGKYVLLWGKTDMIGFKDINEYIVKRKITGKFDISKLVFSNSPYDRIHI
jgi:glutaredoxin